MGSSAETTRQQSCWEAHPPPHRADLPGPRQGPADPREPAARSPPPDSLVSTSVRLSASPSVSAALGSCPRPAGSWSSPTAAPAWPSRASAFTPGPGVQLLPLPPQGLVSRASPREEPASQWPMSDQDPDRAGGPSQCPDQGPLPHWVKGPGGLSDPGGRKCPGTAGSAPRTAPSTIPHDDGWTYSDNRCHPRATVYITILSGLGQTCNDTEPYCHVTQSPLTALCPQRPLCSACLSLRSPIP